MGRSDRAPDDLWLLPLPGATADGARPRQLTNSLPAVLAIDQFAAGTRISFEARDGLHVEGTLYLPSCATGEDAVYISRIRKDPTVKNGISFWCVSDNLRKGAALNAVQIAEVLVNRKLIQPKRKAA